MLERELAFLCGMMITTTMNCPAILAFIENINLQVRKNLPLLVSFTSPKITLNDCSLLHCTFSYLFVGVKSQHDRGLAIWLCSYDLIQACMFDLCCGVVGSNSFGFIRLAISEDKLNKTLSSEKVLVMWLSNDCLIVEMS